MTNLEVVFGVLAAVVTGWVLGDTVQEYRDQKAMQHFHAQLDAVSGFPAHWKMRP